ncbi:MAG: hypothetical protein V3T59_06740 [Desulfobacterales bacterium]
MPAIKGGHKKSYSSDGEIISLHQNICIELVFVQIFDLIIFRIQRFKQKI